MHSRTGTGTFIRTWYGRSTYCRWPAIPLPQRTCLSFSLVADYSVALFDGRNHALLISDRIDTLQLPDRDMTVAGWVMVDYPQSWGGFLSVMQDNGDYEKGWVFGYMNDRFSFGLSTEGANQDETGTMTYLESATPFEFGRWYHVAATYDGEVMRLYVNGNRSAESRAQTGAILLPAIDLVLHSAPIVMMMKTIACRAECIACNSGIGS